jgi:uncharacterized phage-like protein YoqJ
MILGYAKQRKNTVELDNLPAVAERGEDGRWYCGGVAVPTALTPKINAFRQKERNIAITGHRDIDKRTVEAAKWWVTRIAQKYPNATIITGGALGTDMLVATLAIKAGLRSKVYLPFEFETHTSRWNAGSKAALKWILERSEVRVVGSSEYSVRLYYRRNEWMVDNADLVIAFWDGRLEGGTAGCIRYAQYRGKKVFDAFSRGEMEALPGENIYEKLDALYTNDNNTIDYFDDATYFSSIFKIDMERHGDGTEGNEAKERELAQVSPFKLKYYFQSADYYISNGVVFERHEELSYRDRDSIACRIKMATKCSGDEARKIAKYLEIVDKERRMEDQWVTWLRINFQKTLNYLEVLFYNLADLEPDAEMEALVDWVEDPEAESYKPKFVQSWNDDPSEDDWDELEDDGIMVDPSYGWHRLNDPIVYDAPLPKIEDRLSPLALPIYQRIQSLSGNALAGYGKVLYRLWAEWKDSKRNSFKQRDWDELWAAYKYRKSEGLELRAK